MTRPTAGSIEQRSAPATAAIAVEGRRLHGVIPYGVESRDLGGWREVIDPGALDGARLDDLVATVDHAGVPLARHPGTLALEDRADGCHWALELPDSRSDVREAVARGDLRASSWRMIVGRERWVGDVRHVEAIDELRDVSVVTTPAYQAARAEYRSAPDQMVPPAPPATEPQEAIVPESTGGTTATIDPAPSVEDRAAEPVTERAGTLRVEDRAATPERTLEQRVETAIRSVNPGEARSLNTTTAEAVAPEEQGQFLWDRLRPASVMLAAGVRVIPTGRESVVWPRLTADVNPTWVGEEDIIPAGDPAFGTLEAKPKKLAHRVELSNEVIDDSSPAIVDVLNVHLASMLALKLDASMLEGNPTTNPDSIRGLKYTAGIQTLSMGTNGAALTDYDAIIEAVGLLLAANVPGPYVAVAHPRTLTALALLKEETGSNAALSAPAGVPALVPTAQLSVNETKGTATNATSAYVFAPAQVVLVRRADATIELDRSRLFDRDMSEMRAKLRADLIVPNPTAVVRIDGITPAA